MNQKIRIKLKSFDHNLVDKSAEKIVKTVKSTGAVVNGRDLMQEGIKPGPQLGKLLQGLLETVLEEPERNTKEELLVLVKELEDSPND